MPGCCCESENNSKAEEKAQETTNIKKAENPETIMQVAKTGSEQSEPGQGTSGSKLAQSKIKEIMGQYKIKIWKPEVFAALSEYTESELHIIGRTLRKKKSDGKVKNPSALLAKDAESVCVDILCGEVLRTWAGYGSKGHDYK